MNKLVTFLLFLVLFVGWGSLTSYVQAQDCTINLSNLDGVQSASGATTICENEPLLLPDLPFNAPDDWDAPGIVWAIYTNYTTSACQPSSPNPITPPDPCLTFTILSDWFGNAIYGEGTADLTQSNLFAEGQSAITICIVPVLTPDTTGVSEIVGNCTGINTGVDYPCFTILNPDLNPLLCSDCPILAPNDTCSNAFEFDITAPTSIEGNAFSNECATTEAGDPDTDDCFGDFPDDDPYSATVWFNFTGNGGTYSLNIIDCSGSVEPQLGDSQIALYSGTCGSLTLVDCNDNLSGSTLAAELTNIVTTEGTDYYVVVDGFGDDRGEFCFDLIEVAAPACLANAGNISIPDPANLYRYGRIEHCTKRVQHWFHPANDFG